MIFVCIYVTPLRLGFVQARTDILAMRYIRPNVDLQHG